MSLFDWPEQRLDPELIAARGHRAAEIIRDEVFQEAMAEAERTFLHQWLNGETVQDREAAHAKMHALEDIRRIFDSYVADATVVTPDRR
jgi:hypothetical protein